MYPYAVRSPTQSLAGEALPIYLVNTNAGHRWSSSAVADVSMRRARRLGMREYGSQEVGHADAFVGVTGHGDF
ncbi:hypothetical protein HETIRDRAFT_453242 [Heterobasidion irregulare TC 32-1]|uniref:Uncharacterized protein n=1 Tax=Heterobasidion irregulare (strain TC 32-1) TaxID=747525 RepID=W4JYG4_HETIT|nr:uncharacterized protein HETIRDRAFT_453242 [Heterobasidion irregulare TC 32-1]ETW78612.1 hypothetical protein HETIRDRAFT_453242 [Heterobasidion irregulare TC 32-1]